MMKAKRLTSGALAALIVIVFLPGASDAQMIAGLTLEKLGILTTPGTGARPYAMGGAYTSVSDDAFALLYNPAGLAQVKRKEFTVGLHHSRNEIINNYLGTSAEQMCTSTSFGHAAVVYPYPAYRGSLVIGFGVFRAGTSDLEYLKNGYLMDVLGIPAISENLYIQTGTIFQYHAGLGLDISPNISVGVGMVIWDQSIDFTDDLVYEDMDSTAYLTDDVSMDLDGFSLNFGLMLRLHENIRAGVMISSPTWLSYNGDGIIYYDGTYPGGGGWTTDPELSFIDEEYTLPMRFRGGMSFTNKNLLLSADATYIDYTQTKWNDLTLIDEFDPSGGHVLKSVWNLNFGAEISLPRYPVRLRGGYRYTPIILSTTEEITYIADDYPETIVADFDVERERHMFTVGAGALIDRVLTIDLCVAFGGFERDTGDLNEEQNLIELVVSGAYRF